MKLTQRQQRSLQNELNRTQEARVYRRILAVREVAQGKSIGEIARQLGVARQSVYNWLVEYQQSYDPADLSDGPRSGRPSLWTEALEEVLQATLEQTPQEWNYRATSWTVPLLQQHLESQAGRVPSDSSLRRALGRLGYTWKRSQYVLAPDPEREKKTRDSPKDRGIAGPQRGFVRG